MEWRYSQCRLTTAKQLKVSHCLLKNRTALISWSWVRKFWDALYITYLSGSGIYILFWNLLRKAVSSSQGQLVAHNRMKCWRGELWSASSIYKFSNGSVSGTVSLGELGGAELASRHVICGSSLLVFVLTQRIFLRALLTPQSQHSESV